MAPYTRTTKTPIVSPLQDNKWWNVVTLICGQFFQLTNLSHYSKHCLHSTNWHFILIKRLSTRVTPSTLWQMSTGTNVIIGMTSSECCQWLLNRRNCSWRGSQTLERSMWKTDWWRSRRVWKPWVNWSIGSICWLAWSWQFVVITLIIRLICTGCWYSFSIATADTQAFVKNKKWIYCTVKKSEMSHFWVVNNVFGLLQAHESNVSCVGIVARVVNGIH